MIRYFLRHMRSSYRRIDRHRPMGTLVGVMKPHMFCGQGSLHPEEDRCLTVLECQRIQVKKLFFIAYDAGWIVRYKVLLVSLYYANE